CVLLALAGLDRIIDYDDHSGRVVLEPGVTFRQLALFLRARDSRFMPPYTGSGAHTSVVGNIMERGIGKGLYENMASHVVACEAILANGETLKTSLDTPGPALFGLIPQSNLAVVVELTLQLTPQPKLSQVLLFALADEAALGRAAEALREQMLRAAPRLQIAFMNDYRVVTQVTQFPFDRCDADMVLPRAWLDAWCAELGFARWTGFATLWADDSAELDARCAALCGVLADIGIEPRIEPLTIVRDEAIDDTGLNSAYWRKRSPMPSDPDPDRDRCGVIWIAPALRLNAAALQAVLPPIEAIMLAHGFEPGIGLRWGNAASLRLIVGLFYDRDHAGADARALACRDALQKLCSTQQLARYRHGLLDGAIEGDAGVRSVMRALKSHFDPHGILAPDRYPFL
ncbi:MAG TPA: FAD-binding oxidoreductase, partial [Herbaspirillum sp.]|nr:FAD-binding oxidoreductase [Herbaspirillum sp.]